VDHLYEPDRRTLLSMFMPMYADLMIWASAAHSQTSEQAMRVVAMTTATDLADQLVRSLTLSYNKARQAAITTEILEVNTGAEAARA
jgi:F-type H+-transporting ATPase subunit gamma